jgi:predicted Zn-dependent protease
MLGLLYEQAADQLAKAPTDRIEYLKMAVASLREYLNANNDVNGYMILANVFLSEKHANYKAALVALAEGLSLNPECLEVRRFMVNCLRKTNRHKDALDHMHVILRSPSALPVDYLMTADILRVLGRKANARQVLKAGVERFPQRAAMLERELRRGTEEKKDEGTSANRPAF